MKNILIIAFLITILVGCRKETSIVQKVKNIKKINNNSIQSQYLYLLLEDVTKNQLGKTLIKNN